MNSLLKLLVYYYYQKTYLKGLLFTSLYLYLFLNRYLRRLQLFFKNKKLKVINNTAYTKKNDVYRKKKLIEIKQQTIKIWI